MINALQVGDVFEHEWIIDGNLPPDSLVHGIDEGLVDGHALLGQAGGVVDGNVGQLRVGCPVLVQNEQQFLMVNSLQILDSGWSIYLSSAQCKYWYQTSSSSCDNVSNGSCESGLSRFSFLSG